MHFNIKFNLNLYICNRNLLFIKKFDYRLLTSELKRLSSNQFIVKIFIFENKYNKNSDLDQFFFFSKMCLQYLQNHLKSSFQNRYNSLSTSDEPSNDSSDRRMLVDVEPNLNDLNKPTILQVIDLFSSLVDAHFTHITLSSKAQETIADVLQLIETQVIIYMMTYISCIANSILLYAYY